MSKTKKQTEILYWEMGLSDGTSYRFVRSRTAAGGFEVFASSPSWPGRHPKVEGPISIEQFLEIITEFDAENKTQSLDK